MFWSILCVGILSVPLFYLLVGVFYSATDNWVHFADHLLAHYMLHTLYLAIGVGILSLFIGIGTAWIVSVYRFPGRDLLAAGLALPLAIPVYIVAYTYNGIFDFTGPVYHFTQTYFADAEGRGMLLDIQTMPGLIVLMAFNLYPYVYLITRASFSRQSAALLEASQSLGQSPRQTFFRIALPLARPAYVGGVTLVLMEVLNEYGAVHNFGIDTFTTGIFKAWFGMGDTHLAIRLAVILMGIVAALILIEYFQRQRTRSESHAPSGHALKCIPLKKGQAVAAIFFCLFPVLIGFIIPVAQLFAWSLQTLEHWPTRLLWQSVRNSFFLAAATAALAALFALLISYTVRLHRNALAHGLSRVAILGYSIPGAVIAIGVMLPITWLETRLDAFARVRWEVSTGLFLSGTIVILIYAYLVRYLAIAFSSIDAGFSRVSLNLDEAARSLGSSPLVTFFRIDLPLIRGAVLAGAMLVFIDLLKELPLTLILRPFNFTTLAIQAFEMSSDEQIRQSSPFSLVIIATGLLPVIWLSHLIGSEKS